MLTTRMKLMAELSWGKLSVGCMINALKTYTILLGA